MQKLNIWDILLLIWNQSKAVVTSVLVLNIVYFSAFCFIHVLKNLLKVTVIRSLFSCISISNAVYFLCLTLKSSVM